MPLEVAIVGQVCGMEKAAATGIAENGTAKRKTNKLLEASLAGMWLCLLSAIVVVIYVVVLADVANDNNVVI